MTRRSTDVQALLLPLGRDREPRFSPTRTCTPESRRLMSARALAAVADHTNLAALNDRPSVVVVEHLLVPLLNLSYLAVYGADAARPRTSTIPD